MITPTEDDLAPVYGYVYPPPTPGIRRLSGYPEKNYRLAVDLDAPIPNNFIPSTMPHYNNFRQGGIPIAVAIPPNVLEGFGMTAGNRFLIRLIIFALIICLIFYLVNRNV
jgi:hypothetical protein